MEPMAVVQDIYAAFGRGDVAAIVDHMADDVAWEPGMQDHGVPWLSPGSGKGHVGDFFATIGEQVEMRRFEPVAFLTGESHVAVVVDLEAVVRGSGAPITDREVHLWTFDDEGRVTSLRHFLDTHQHVVASRAAAATGA